MSKPERFPLSWPAGYPVTERRQESSFKTGFVQARDEMLNELKLLIGSYHINYVIKHVIISCNMPHNKDGLLTGKNPLMYPNPGVAVYFTYNGEDKVIACDHWTHLHANLRAIGLTIAAMRSMERHKCTQILSRAMDGMKALPMNAGESNAAWWLILQVDQHADADTISAAYKHLRKYYHPDMATGNATMFDLVQKAYKEAEQ